MRYSVITIMAAMTLACGQPASADWNDPMKVKRVGPYEFAEKPSISTEGDQTTITFAAKAACDVVVAVEDTQGKIVRHLAAGVLGANAPEPLTSGSLRQTLVWDGKDDMGRYVDDRDSLRVRVSLGLDPQFERTLYWDPKRRITTAKPIMQATPEGVYVFEGNGFDHVRLFGHDGKYLRTVYPFPRAGIRKSHGLAWHEFPDGAKIPVKTNWSQSTFLTAGRVGTPYTYKLGTYRSTIGTVYHDIHTGTDATAMAVAPGAGRLALAMWKVNRLGTDGSTGGLELTGPEVKLSIQKNRGRETDEVEPRTAALSPDGKWLYLGGYVYGHIKRASNDIRGISEFESLPVVMRVNMEANDPAEVWLGSAKSSGQGSGDNQFKSVSWLTTDAAGRVYVCDYPSGRIQVFTPDGKLHKSINAHQPAQAFVHPKTGDIYVFSWPVKTEHKVNEREPVLTQYGPVDDPKQKAQWPLPSTAKDVQVSWGLLTGFPYQFAIDFWSEKLRIWQSQDWARESVLNRGKLRYHGVEIFELRDGKFEQVDEFSRDARKDIVKLRPPAYWRQRLYVNPATGMLYIGEADAAVGKSFHTLIEVDPDTGKSRPIKLPFDAEDLAFGPEGLAYLRTAGKIVRYQPITWREVPWDYGEEHESVGFSSSRDGERASVKAALNLPSNAFWHHGGIAVSSRGHLVVSCYYSHEEGDRKGEAGVFGSSAWAPTNYPGRVPSGGRGGAILHIFDKHGQIVHQDAAPGLGDINGVFIDERDNLYILSAAARIFENGKRYFNDMAGTMIKFKPGKGRVISQHKAVPIKIPDPPDRPHDLTSAQQGQAWVEGAEWMYPGVGWGGKNYGIGCACWNARFAMDYFARSFTPGIERSDVGVLDANGNLICRIGQYGNVDDGKPLVADGGPPNTNELEDNSVGLMYPAYLGVQTDKRLYIADPGNMRVVAVRLAYEASETVPLGK